MWKPLELRREPLHRTGRGGYVLDPFAVLLLQQGVLIIGVWRSQVARFVRDEEVPGSNPGTPTFRKQPSRTVRAAFLMVYTSSIESWCTTCRSFPHWVETPPTRLKKTEPRAQRPRESARQSIRLPACCRFGAPPKWDRRALRDAPVSLPELRAPPSDRGRHRERLHTP